MRDQKRALKIQVLIRFKLMDFKTKYFPTYEISKDKVLNIQASMGFKPMTNILQLPKYQRRKPMKYQRRELMDYHRRKPTTFWLSWDSNP